MVCGWFREMKLRIFSQQIGGVLTMIFQTSLGSTRITSPWIDMSLLNRLGQGGYIPYLSCNLTSASVQLSFLNTSMYVLHHVVAAAHKGPGYFRSGWK